jgi:hypothetical protein
VRCVSLGCVGFVSLEQVGTFWGGLKHVATVWDTFACISLLPYVVDTCAATGML